jgi:hypothetical protein
MKKIITALIITGLSYNSTSAQLAQGLCATSSNKVCKKSSDKTSKSCYATHYAQNFKVCNNEYGYYICCESPSEANSTNPHPDLTALNAGQNADNNGQNADNNAEQNNDNVTVSGDDGRTNEMIAPESQSYPPYPQPGYSIMVASSYEGYYPQKGKIKVCYYGDSVAENNQNPYHGCPSPQFDGPEKNNTRNINANTPSDFPPINGWTKGK